MIPIPYRNGDSAASTDSALAQFGANLRVAIPGIIQAFDPATQTVSVQPAISEVIRIDGVPTVTPLPVLHDVPIVLQRAGGMCVTLPISAGDECLLVFADMCIDGWYQSGGVQGQLAKFRHAIGDGFAVIGPWNQKRLIPNYSTSSLQVRSDDGRTVIDVKPEAVTITSPAVTAGAAGGTALPVLSENFLTWFNGGVMPFLVSKGYTGSPPPTTSLTTVFEAE